MRGSAVPLLVLVCSCGGPPPDFSRVAGQDRAEQIVWNETYGMTPEAPPGVQWRRHLDCSCSPGNPCTGFSDGGNCYGGLYYHDSYADVALPTGYLLSSTAYAHELFHAKLERDTGDLDPGHTDPRWRNGGVVDQAYAALRRSGL